jgi:hypothetical protein
MWISPAPRSRAALWCCNLGFVEAVPARAPDRSAANLRFNVTGVKTRLRAWYFLRDEMPRPDVRPLPVTVAALATLALGSRELALKFGGTSGVWANAVWSVCAIGGATVILLFGLLLFAASLGPARPF